MPLATGANTISSRHERRSKKKDLSWITCYNCEKPGHYASNCVEPRKKKPNPVDLVAALQIHPQSDGSRRVNAVVGLALRGEMYHLAALLDRDATSNFISQQAVTDLDLAKGEALPQGLSTIYGQPLQTYKQHPISLNAVDSKGRSLYTTGSFVAADFVGFDIILGLPWLTEWKVSIHFGNREWWYSEMSEMTAP